MHANIDVHSIRFIAEFTKYVIKCIENFQSHCANMTFADRSRYDRTFQQVTHMVPRLASAVTWSRGPRPWRGFTHGPLITAKCPIRMRLDQETNMAMEGEGGVDKERVPGGV